VKTRTLEDALKYLGDHYILHPESTFDPTRPSILNQWKLEKLLDKQDAEEIA
jgi:hypothetical protein